MQNKTKTKLLAVISLMALGGILLSHSDSVSAYSLTVSTSGSVTANVIPSADNGIGTTVVTDNVNIISNCRAGYTMTIAGPSDNNLYLNGDDTNNTSGTYFTPVDGTSALNSSANANKWGYSLTANSRTGVFTALSSTAATLKTPSQTASPDSDINTTIPVYYGTSVNSSMAPGNYTFSNSNSVTYSVVMDTSCTMYSIQYDGSTPDNPNGMGTTDSSTGVKSVKQINIAEDTKVTLLAPNFKKAGYGFLGWSTDSNAYTHFADNDATNDPIIYGPNEDVIVDSDMMATADNRNIITMYAVWIPALKDGSNNTVYFQDWDNPNTNLPHDGCSTLTQTNFDDTITDEKGKIIVNKNSVVALTDKRDNMVYAVARLADGNCWMIENLRLEHQYTKGQNQNDSSITNQNLSQGYGGTTGTYGNFVGLADSESANFGNFTTSNTIYKSDGSGDVFNFANNTLEDIGTTSDPAYRFPRYNSDNTQSLIDSTTYTQDYQDYVYTSSPTYDGTFSAANLYSYGNYYTWAAATANTNYTAYDSAGINSASICPLGWRLPSGEYETGETTLLFQAYGGTNKSLSRFPNNFIYSGTFNGSSEDGRGSYGSYYSKEVACGGSFGNCIGYVSLSLASNGYLEPYDARTKTIGSTIRCVINTSDIEISLNSNNGTGAISRVYGAAGSTVALPSSSNPSASIAVSGYAFKNWNTAPDGSGTSYTSSYAIPAGSTGVTLYAQWNPQYTITYVNNCMSWASGNSNCTATSTANTSTQKIVLNASGNGSGTLKAYNVWTSLSGWKIKEWTTSADGTGTSYPVNSTYSVSGASAGDSITLYAHWTPVYSIQYDGNGADNPNGMGTTDQSTGVKSVKQTNVSQGDPVVLLASNFKRAGYGFAGWSTSPTATIGGTDKIYGPMETIDAPAYPTNGTNIITMYAVWVEAEKDGSNNPVYLQDFTTSDCNALTKADFNTSTGVITPGSVIALTDKRDDEVYAVAKLADNNCWMIENLRLEHAGTVGNNKNDSSVTNQSLSQGYGGTTGTYGNFVGLAASESANFTDTTASLSFADGGIYKSDGSGSVFDSANSTLEDIGTSNYPSRRFPRYNSNNTQSSVDSTTYTENYGNVSSPSASGTYKTSTVSSYGNYYTWAAAMANTNYYNSDTGASGSESANTSICPSSWHLPSSNGTTKEYGVLSKSYGGSGSNQSDSSRFRTFPNNFLYSGYYRNSYANSRGSYGYYWSRSVRSGYDSESYALYLGSTYLWPSYYQGRKDYGYSVRCLIGS